MNQKSIKIYCHQLCRRDWFLLLLILVLGLSLRLINLGAEPYWGDEILSLDIVKHFPNPRDLVVYLQTVEIHPPLYYLLLHYWTAAFGWGGAAVRSLSLLFGLAVIVLTYCLGRSFFNKTVGLAAALVTAVLPLQIEFSQEARPYIIFTFFGLLASWAFWQYWQRGSKCFLAIYAAANLFGLYLHYSYLFFLAALSFGWLFLIIASPSRRRFKSLLIWLLAQAAIFIGFYWWLTTFFYKLELGRYPIFDMMRAWPSRRLVDFFEAILSQLIWFSKNEPVSNIEVLTTFLFRLVFIGGIVYLIMHQKLFLEKCRQYRLGLFLSGWLAIAPLALFLFAPYSAPYTLAFERHIIVVSIFVVFLIAFILSQLDGTKRFIFYFLFFTSIFSFTKLVVDNDALWDPSFRLSIAAEYIKDNYQAGDLILVANVAYRTDFNHFLPNNLSAYGLHPLNLLTDDFLSSRETLGLAENEFQLRDDYYYHKMMASASLADRKLVFLIRKEKAKRIWTHNLAQDPLLISWLQKNGWQRAMTSLGKLFPVELYRRKRDKF